MHLSDSRQLTQDMSTPGANKHVVTVEGDASGFAQRITADAYTFSAGGRRRDGHWTRSVPVDAGSAWHL